MDDATNTNRPAEEATMTTITWTTGTGKTATVTVSLVTEDTVSHYCDGDRTEITKPCCEIEIVATIEGMGEVGTDYHRVIGHHQGVAAQCGKLGILEINAARIDAAIAELKATPEWAAKIAREKQADAEAAEYEASTARINRAMAR